MIGSPELDVDGDHRATASTCRCSADGAWQV